jgi:hypothetical protein
MATSFFPYQWYGKTTASATSNILVQTEIQLDKILR